MNRLRAWLDPSGFRAALLLALALALANGVWILLDHTSPSWDQAHYLNVTWQYKQALTTGGVGGLIDSIHSVDPGHGPLFTTVLLPFFYVLDDVTRSGMVLNLILAPILYLSAGQIAMHLFGDWRARLLTILVVATMPVMVGLYHNVLQDFPLTVIATASLLLMLKTDRFQRRGMSVALGAVLGLGTLTKVTFPAFVAGPLLVTLVDVGLSRMPARRKTGAALDLRRVGINLTAALAAYCAIVVPWYATSWSATVNYVESTTGGSLAEGVGPSNPLALDAISSFTMAVVNFQLTWIIGLIGLLAICFNLRRLAGWLMPPVQTQRLLGVAFLLSWVLIPYLSVALGHNQDPRLMAAIFPGIAVIVASAIVGIERRLLRIVLTSLLVVAMAYQTANHVTPLRPDFLPKELIRDLGPTMPAVITFDSRPIGVEVLPGDDYATPIVEYIETTAGRRAGGDSLPPTIVCTLQSDPVVNLNTLGFLLASREDPFELRELYLGPEGKHGLARALTECDFAIYVRPPGPIPGLEDSRIVLVNETVAAQHMTPRLFNLFERPGRPFPVSASALSGDLREDFNGTAGDWARVLVRKKDGG